MLGGRESNEKNTFLTSPKCFDSTGLLLLPPSATFAPSIFPVTQVISFVAQHKCTQRFKVKVTTCLNPTAAVVKSKRSGGLSLNPLHLWRRDQWEVFATERAVCFNLPPLHSPRHFILCLLLLLGTMLAARQPPVAKLFCSVVNSCQKLDRINNKHVVHWSLHCCFYHLTV